MIKLRQIYLGKGAFEGHCYLSEDWLVAATQNHVDSDAINPTGEAADEHCGYGYYIWMNSVPGTYRAYGREGQFVIVRPERDAVVAVQAMHHDVQEILDLICGERFCRSFKRSGKKHMIKLFLTDMDGTLFPEYGQELPD